MSVFKAISFIVLSYLIIGILVTIFIPIHPNICSPCPQGAFCALCAPFDDQGYSLLDIFTAKFWRSVIYWPMNIFGYFELQSNIRSGRKVIIDPLEMERY